MPRMTQAEVDAYNLRHRTADPLLQSEPDDTPESEIQDQIESECRRRRWYVVRSRMDRPTTTALGVPDLIIAINEGRTLWVEVKRPGQKLKPEQAGAQMWLGMLGHRVAVVHSLQEFLQLMDGTKA